MTRPAEPASDRAVHSPAVIWGPLLTVYLIWGTTYLGIRICLETMPPLIMGGLRWSLAGAILGAALLARRQPLPRFERWPGLAVLAFLFLVLGNGGVVLAEQWVPSGLTAVIIAMSPFWMVGTEALMPQGERLTRRRAIGLLIGFAGIVMLVWPELTLPGESGRRFVVGVIALQIAEVGWALGSSYSRRHALEEEPLSIAAVEMIASTSRFPASTFNSVSYAFLIVSICFLLC